MAGNEYGLISATLDGRKLQNLDSHRAQSGCFNITVPKNKVFNNVPETRRAKVDGFFVLFEPLPAGMHDLHTTVSVANPIEPSYNHAADLTYHLIGKP
jgi:hypothetical protein